MIGSHGITYRHLTLNLLNVIWLCTATHTIHHSEVKIKVTSSQAQSTINLLPVKFLPLESRWCRSIHSYDGIGHPALLQRRGRRGRHLYTISGSASTSCTTSLPPQWPFTRRRSREVQHRHHPRPGDSCYFKFRVYMQHQESKTSPPAWSRDGQTSRFTPGSN